MKAAGSAVGVEPPGLSDCARGDVADRSDRVLDGISAIDARLAVRDLRNFTLSPEGYLSRLGNGSTRFSTDSIHLSAFL